jgi:hypothetical protein
MAYDRNPDKPGPVDFTIGPGGLNGSDREELRALKPRVFKYEGDVESAPVPHRAAVPRLHEQAGGDEEAYRPEAN